MGYDFDDTDDVPVYEINGETYIVVNGILYKSIDNLFRKIVTNNYVSVKPIYEINEERTNGYGKITKEESDNKIKIN
ncbi:MAG: hypothetical protein ACFFG0_08025 [Candidatus Thorarchaeota archaeon]